MRFDDSQMISILAAVFETAVFSGKHLGIFGRVSAALTRMTFTDPEARK
jgi:hypothetical protein